MSHVITIIGMTLMLLGLPGLVLFELGGKLIDKGDTL